jgi:hypothetical protein
MLVWLALRGPAVIIACRYGGDPLVDGRTLLCKRCTGTSRLSGPSSRYHPLGSKYLNPVVAAPVPAVSASSLRRAVRSHLSLSPILRSPQSGRRVSLLCCAVPLKSLIQLHCCRSARPQTSRRSTAMRCALWSVHSLLRAHLPVRQFVLHERTRITKKVTQWLMLPIWVHLCSWLGYDGTGGAG